MAQVLVQNRVAIAEARLPEEVKRQGVTTKKQSTSIVLLIALTSPDERYDTLYLSNYATLRIVDELKRIPGVGDVSVFGGSGLQHADLARPRPSSRPGGSPPGTSPRPSASRTSRWRPGRSASRPRRPARASSTRSTASAGFRTRSQFEQIILKTGEMGRVTRVRDVARVELGSQNYNQYAELNGSPTAAIAIYQLPGANALEVAAAGARPWDRLGGSFPEGLEWSIPFDTTKAVEASIAEVYETLFIAIALVFLTIFVFLQDWRATLIPAVTIPVSLIGTFTVMAVLGFSINMLTLFGLVLAIGIVVDDAIVVVENVTRLIDEEGLLGARRRCEGDAGGRRPGRSPPRWCCWRSSCPLLSWAASRDSLNQQFALTIAAATVISSLNALTLSPALAALLLRPSQERRSGLLRRLQPASTG